MSELDEIKEQIAHLRTWLNIFALIDVGLVAWLVANYKDAEKLLLIFGILAIVGATGLIWVLNRMIEHRIRKLRDL